MIFSSYIRLSLHVNAEERKIICSGLSRGTPPNICRQGLKEYNCNCNGLAYRITTGWMVWGSNPAEWKRFSGSTPIQTGPGVHPASTIGIASIQGQAVGVALTTFPRFSPGFNIGIGIPILPFCASNRMLWGDFYPFLYPCDCSRSLTQDSNFYPWIWISSCNFLIIGKLSWCGIVKYEVYIRIYNFHPRNKFIGFTTDYRTFNCPC
jgi:hypothetical protein